MLKLESFHSMIFNKHQKPKNGKIDQHTMRMPYRWFNKIMKYWINGQRLIPFPRCLTNIIVRELYIHCEQLSYILVCRDVPFSVWCSLQIMAWHSLTWTIQSFMNISWSMYYYISPCHSFKWFSFFESIIIVLFYISNFKTLWRGK